jgi:hypothetical protein
VKLFLYLIYLQTANFDRSLPLSSPSINFFLKALAADVTLKRQDIKLIAVYSATIPVVAAPLPLFCTEVGGPPFRIAAVVPLDSHKRTGIA